MLKAEHSLRPFECDMAPDWKVMVHTLHNKTGMGGPMLAVL